MLPRLILIADRFTDQNIYDRTVEAVQAGVKWIQLRDHAASADKFLDAAVRLKDEVQSIRKELLISVNGRPDVAHTLGIHYHAGKMAPKIERSLFPVVGYSAHDEEEAEGQVRAGVDYLFFSPVFPTSSKPGNEAKGIQKLDTFCAAVKPVPVYALGGITPERFYACVNAGAYGVAVISGILHAPNVTDAVQAYQRVMLIEKNEKKK